MDVSLSNIIQDELYAFIVLWVIIVSAGSIIYSLDYCITNFRREN
jgi:hypothetical protein